ncbi:MAG: hypothetical protein JXB34_09795 [Bacteroidales bacterium]|nr:hypothetical protein [Bacteroidales bacterium]
MSGYQTKIKNREFVRTEELSVFVSSNNSAFCVFQPVSTIKLLFLVFLVIQSGLIFCQYENFFFEPINKKNGLPDNSIYSIYQDKTGYIWLCSANGIIQFNGNNFKHFLKGDTTMGRNINSNRVAHVMQDSKGQFWISTSNSGINIYNPETELFEYLYFNNTSNCISGNNVNKCFEDSKGQIWIGTLGNGLNMYNPKTKKISRFLHSVADTNSLPANNVTDITEDLHGNLWVATDGPYISRYNRETGKFKRFKTSFPDINLGGYFKKLYFTNDSTLWIATDGTGLYQLNTHTHKFKQYYHNFKPGSLNSNNLKGLIADNEGNLIIITDGGGINIMNIKTSLFKHITYTFNNPNGITTNALLSIYKDRGNNIWIGTYKAGLLLYKENTRDINIVSQTGTNSGLCHKSVLSIHAGTDGKVWYGTDGGGLSCYDIKTRKFTCYMNNPTDPKTISNNVIKDIHEDKDGNLWIATFFGGLNKFDRKSREFKRYMASYTAQNSISSNNTWCIMEDSEGKLWIGNFSTGLDIFNPKTETFAHVHQNYTDSSTLSHTQVSSMVQDSLGNIWVGTLNGLNYMDYKTKNCRRFYHNPNNKNSLSDDFITSLYYDSKNRLWIGTDGGGLNLLEGTGIFKSFGTTEGLPGMSVQSMQEDCDGNIWISTKNGLAKLNPEKGSFFNMDEMEGLLDKEFNWNSSAKGPGGKLFFGSINGACVFDPLKVKFDKPFPPLVFTGINVFNRALVAGETYHGQILMEKSISYGGSVKLTSKENAFSIEFAAIEFNKPANIKYKYMLEGFDNDYTIIGANQRSATYTNLRGGTYIFRLFSTNSAGLWNDKPIEAKIIIVPPFYKKWWFNAISLVVVLIILAGIYRQNILKHKQLIRAEALNREKELIKKRNEELKSEIASNTLLLLNKNESLEQIKTKLEGLICEAGSAAPQIAELMKMVDSQMGADVYWEQFEYNFDQVYKNLLSRLKARHPNLTPTNLKLCAYLRLNMTSKEIASLMNITPSAIDKARNRLRKKLNLQPGDDLVDFLNNY